jgi:hypothetical protein
MLHDPKRFYFPPTTDCHQINQLPTKNTTLQTTNIKLTINPKWGILYLPKPILDLTLLIDHYLEVLNQAYLAYYLVLLMVDHPHLLDVQQEEVYLPYHLNLLMLDHFLDVQQQEVCLVDHPNLLMIDHLLDAQQ